MGGLLGAIGRSGGLRRLGQQYQEGNIGLLRTQIGLKQQAYENQIRQAQEDRAVQKFKMESDEADKKKAEFERPYNIKYSPTLMHLESTYGPKSPEYQTAFSSMRAATAADETGMTQFGRTLQAKELLSQDAEFIKVVTTAKVESLKARYNKLLPKIQSGTATDEEKKEIGVLRDNLSATDKQFLDYQKLIQDRDNPKPDFKEGDIRNYESGDKKIIEEFNNGKWVFKTSAPRQSSSSDEQVDTLARQVVNGLLDPLSISKRGGLQAGVFNRIDQISPGFNINEASANARMKRSENLQFSIKSIDSISPLLTEMGDVHKSLNLSRFPTINAAELWLRKHTGDPKVIALTNLKNDIVFEIQRALTNSNMLTDTRIKIELENLQNSFAPEQMKAAIDNIRIILSARRNALAKDVYGGGSGGSGGSAGKDPLGLGL